MCAGVPWFVEVSISVRSWATALPMVACAVAIELTASFACLHSSMDHLVDSVEQSLVLFSVVLVLVLLADLGERSLLEAARLRSALVDVLVSGVDLLRLTRSCEEVESVLVLDCLVARLGLGFGTAEGFAVDVGVAWSDSSLTIFLRWGRVMTRSFTVDAGTIWDTSPP